MKSHSVLLQLLGGSKSSKYLRHWINFWPPFLGARIRVKRIAPDIRYKKPGRGTVRAEFRLSDSQIDDIREKLKTLPKYEPVFTVQVRDEARSVIAEVESCCTCAEKT